MGSAVANWPLVKTAFFASDPNLGRILAAVGYAGIADLDQTLIDLYLDDVLVARQGGRNPDYREEDGQRVMQHRASLNAWGVYEVDKAIYEVIYETRNRPDWAHIPLSAVQDGLVGSAVTPSPTNTEEM